LLRIGIGIQNLFFGYMNTGERRIRRWFAMIDYKLTVEVLEARIAPIGWSID